MWKGWWYFVFNLNNPCFVSVHDFNQRNWWHTVYLYKSFLYQPVSIWNSINLYQSFHLKSWFWVCMGWGILHLLRVEDTDTFVPIDKLKADLHYPNLINKIWNQGGNRDPLALVPWPAILLMVVFRFDGAHVEKIYDLAFDYDSCITSTESTNL